jgi:hypothetical protein
MYTVKQMNRKTNGWKWSSKVFQQVLYRVGLLVVFSGVGMAMQSDQFPTRDLHPEAGVAYQGVADGGVAVAGDWCMVAAEGFGSNDRPLFIEGAVRAFRKSSEGWNLGQLIRPGISWDGQGFGRSLSMSGDVLVVGAEQYGLTIRPQVSGAALGRAYVYHLGGEEWQYVQALEPRLFGGGGIHGESYGLGGAVVTDGNQILVSAIDQGYAGAGTMSGTVYSYVRDSSGGWVLDQLITAPPHSQLQGVQALFGMTLALEDDLLAVGTIETFSEGVVLLYRRGANGWQFEHEFALPFNDFISAHWGRHVEIDQGRVVISYVGGDTTPFRDGLWFYEQNGAGGWVNTGSLRSSGLGLEPSDFPYFGNDFEIDGDWLLVGAPGSNVGSAANAGRAVLYHDDAGAGWTEVRRFRNADQPVHLPAGSGLGYRVSMDLEQGVMVGTGPFYQECAPGNPFYCTIGGAYLFDFEKGDRFCGQGNNSLGIRSQLTVTGSLSVGENNFILHGYDMPQGEFAVAVYGQEGPPFPIATGGNLCLTGGSVIHRVQPALLVGESGEVYLDLDLAAPVQASSLLPGTTWGLQLWHRDQVGGMSTTNMSNAVRVTLQ